MKLLIVTQVIDTEHPVLGFFHRWVEEFATHCEQVQVICLQEGKHSLPENVTVHSLGKEEGVNRLVYVWRFYKYIWTLRHEYDQVFVHMNQVYVILGWPVWKALRRKIGLWYMHGSVPLSLRIAEKLADTIFTGSPESFQLASKKVVVTGHGIDVDVFKPLPDVQKDLDLVTVGRITPSKNLETLIDLFAELRKRQDCTLTIVGSGVTEEEKMYERMLHEKVADLELQESVLFYGRVSQSDLPTLLNRAKLFVTVAQNGSLDKAVLEAMACGLSVVSMAPGTISLSLDGQVETEDAFISYIRNLSNTRDATIMEVIYEEHCVRSLIPKILEG